MSQTWNTAVTIGLFVLLSVPVLASIVAAPFYAMLGDGITPQSPRLVFYLVVVAVVLPPVVVIGVYVTSIVLAWQASGPTWYYPLIAGVLGAVLWFGIAGGSGSGIKWLHANGKPRRRDDQRPS